MLPIVSSEDDMKEVVERLSDLLLFSNTHLAN